jgi:predicted deacylase
MTLTSTPRLYDAVEVGDLLATVYDVGTGAAVHEARCHRAGVVITVRHLGRVEPGDALATISPAAGPPEYNAVPQR